MLPPDSGRPKPLRRRTLLAALAGSPALGRAQAPWVVERQHAGVALELQFEAEFGDTARAALTEAALQAVAAVAAWFGRFPVAELEVQIQSAPGAGILAGTAFPQPAPWLRLRAGLATDAAALRGDWVLVHEMIHLALPQLVRRERWFHEGAATYCEPWIRLRAGGLSEAELWAGFVRGMPHGLPAAGDAGLDHTSTWGRTYWGGALFCLLGDLRLRRNGGPGLRQALAGVLAAGGHYAQAWPLQRVLAVADATVGGQVLSDLRAEHGAQARAVDLPALWAELGVEPQPDGSVRLAGGARAQQLRERLRLG